MALPVLTRTFPFVVILLQHSCLPYFFDFPRIWSAISVKIRENPYTWRHAISTNVVPVKREVPTNHPAFCLIIKQKYCLSHQKIAKSLFFVLTCDASCPYILNGHTAFSSKFISQAKVHLQVGRHGSTFLPVCRPTYQQEKLECARQDLCACAAVATSQKQKSWIRPPACCVLICFRGNRPD